ncbi:hypothetical protein Tco_1173417 [Tanacetum coccineum]
MTSSKVSSESNRRCTFNEILSHASDPVLCFEQPPRGLNTKGRSVRPVFENRQRWRVWKVGSLILVGFPWASIDNLRCSVALQDPCISDNFATEKVSLMDMGQIYDSFATAMRLISDRTASSRLVYLLYESAGVRVITEAGGRSYKENSKFKRKVATDFAWRLWGGRSGDHDEPSLPSDEDITTTPSPTTTSSSLTPLNAPSKTTSTIQTSSSQDNTSSSFHLKLQISPPSLHEQNSPPHLNPLLDNILDVPLRPLNPQPLQNHPSLNITLSLSPITPLDHTHDTTSPPSPPQPQPPIMGHPLFYNYHDYHGSTCICCSHN